MNEGEGGRVSDEREYEPTSSVVLGAITDFRRDDRKLRQLKVGRYVHWMVQPGEVHRVHRMTI